MDSKLLARKVFTMFPLTVAFVYLFLCTLAGTFAYFPGMIFCLTFFAPGLLAVLYLLKHSPDLLERRMRYKEKELQQKGIVRLFGLLFTLGFIVAPLDFRFDWSEIPLEIVIVANIVVFAGLFIIFSAFKVNAFAARTVEVFEGQKIITTGPYSIVRHPMYAGFVPMLLALGPALGSYWAIVPFILTGIALIPRIINEEDVLIEGIPEYREYRKRVKWRLVPGVW